MKSLKLKSELLDITVLVSESDSSGIPYNNDKDHHVENFLDDGVMVCSFEVFLGVSYVVTCAASFVAMAHISAMMGRCLAKTPVGTLVVNLRSRSNCIYNKLAQTMQYTMYK